MKYYPTAEEKRKQNENFDKLIDKIFKSIDDEKRMNFVLHYSYNPLPENVIEFIKNKNYEIVLQTDEKLPYCKYKISW